MKEFERKWFERHNSNGDEYDNGDLTKERERLYKEKEKELQMIKKLLNIKDENNNGNFHKNLEEELRK